VRAVSNEFRLHDRCACGSSLSSYRAEGGAGSFVLEGTRRVYERARPFRIDHIDLELALDHPARGLEGTAELTFERVDDRATELALDAVGFEVEGVELGGARPRASAYEYDGEVLRVRVPPTLRAGKVRVRYRATPRRGMYFLAPDAAVPDRPTQIWTQCQDEDARHIFPCHDKPHARQTFDVRVSAPTGWFVLSNGERVSTAANERRGRFHYRMREAMPSYLFTLVAGTFVALDGGRVGEVPVTYLVPPGREEDGHRTFARTPEMIALFSRLTGIDFPWSKYAQVVVSDFIFGGMENTGATTMYEHVLLDERASLDITSDDLIAHELAHQWFGDLVTCRDWSHAWLNEGFATYLEHVWREHALGRDEYEHGLRTDLHAYLSEADSRYRRPIVCHDYEAPIDIFDRHLYEKGGLTLHALRLEVGDDAFWKGVNRYLGVHGASGVETRDLQRALESIDGRSLEQFFDQGVHRAGHPRLAVEVSAEAGQLVVSVRQTLDGHGASQERPFELDLELDIGEAKGRKPRREVRRVDEATHTFVIPVRERPRYVVVDPRLRVVGSVRVKAPADLVRQQLVEAPTARGRLLAAEQLARRDDAATLRALAECLERGREFWGVRAAAASSLGRLRTPEAFEVLRKGLVIRHPKVRRAVVQALGEFRSPDAAAALADVLASDPSYLVAATACRALGSTRQKEAFELLQGALGRASWADVVRAAALAGLARLRDERAVPMLVEETRYGRPTRSRRAAIAALAELAPTRASREHLEDMLDDADPYLRVDVVEALSELGDPAARAALQARLGRELDGRVRRRLREALRDLGGRGKREVKQLKDDLDQLRREHEQLKSRLTRLEARTEPKKTTTRK
jgi:aminopeptidase N